MAGLLRLLPLDSYPCETGSTALLAAPKPEDGRTLPASPLRTSSGMSFLCEAFKLPRYRNFGSALLPKKPGVHIALYARTMARVSSQASRNGKSKCPASVSMAKKGGEEKTIFRTMDENGSSVRLARSYLVITNSTIAAIPGAFAGRS
jgi:hypothetical protein